jgi:hypothetical protein
MSRRRARAGNSHAARRPRPVTPSPRGLLERLRAVRNVFGAAAEREKRALLHSLEGARLVRFAQLAALHDDLLFLCAFPGADATRALSRRLLGEIGDRLRALPRAQWHRADDSGMAGSTTRHVFPYPIAQWLARTASQDIEVAWREFAEPAQLDRYLALTARDAEREGLDSGEFSTRAWVRVARPAGARSDLAWMMGASATPTLGPHLEAAWDDAEVPLEWRLAESRLATTHNRLAGTPTVLRVRMRRPPGAPAIAEPLPAIERLSRPSARRIVAVARAALAARCREVNAMSSPNLDEVWWCDLGEGTAMAVLGIAPDRRLNLETNTGYVLFSNGVPIGYGGVTPLYRQANTGINIFDPFRGSEAAFLWMQMLRAFHTLFGCTRFVVNAYQFGAGNAEARRSGAFWFYHRLGFRPASPGARALATREAARIAADRRYRCGAEAMRILLGGDLFLDLPGFVAADYLDEALLPQVGALAARELARQPDRTRAAAHRRVTGTVARMLDAHDLGRWPAPERRGFERLAPVVAALPGLRAWNAAERAALVTMMRAKGAAQERTFALAALEVPRFFHELARALRPPT